jgi:two-component sensor histidine kinase
MPISTRLVISSTIMFVVIGFLALLGIVGTTLWLGERTQAYFAEVIEIRDERTATLELKNALYIAESAQRGFMVTGNEIYLSPYDLAKAQMNRQIVRMKELFAVRPSSLPVVTRLEELSLGKFAEMDETIGLKRNRQDEEALDLFRSNRGKALMDEANVFISGLIAGIDERLERGMAEQQANASWLRLVAALGTILIIGVIGGAVFVLSRYTGELRSARDEVTAFNADLERRVDERTRDLVLARDRATALLSEVNHRIANSLALVSSLVGLQTKALKDDAAKEALAETQDRIFAISLVHKRLYGASAVGVVQLDDYMSGLLDHLRTSLRGAGQGGVSLTYKVEPLMLATDVCVNLGVIVTEWVTNAFKYAYPDGAGEVRVLIAAVEGGMARLVVEDDGTGKVEGAPARGTGLGTRIVAAMATSLRGEIVYGPRERGTAAVLTFPQEL